MALEQRRYGETKEKDSLWLTRRFRVNSREVQVAHSTFRCDNNPNCALLFGGICIQRLKAVPSLHLVDTERSVGPQFAGSRHGEGAVLSVSRSSTAFKVRGATRGQGCTHGDQRTWWRGLRIAERRKTSTFRLLVQVTGGVNRDLACLL